MESYSSMSMSRSQNNWRIQVPGWIQAMH